MSTAVNYDKCRECDAAISRYHLHRADCIAEKATFNLPVVLPDLLWDACRTYKDLPIAELCRTQVTADIAADIVHCTRDLKR